MANDPERERQRLARLYAGMSDGELLRLAEALESLTEVAREVFENELDRREQDLDQRGAEDPFADSAPPAQVELQQLVTVRQFRDLPEALLAKGSLESAGIQCYLGDDNMVRLDWFISNLLGGIKLKVRPEDFKPALEVLDQPIPEGFEVEGLGEYRQPRCPQCRSLDLTFAELKQPAACGGAFPGAPPPLHRLSWKCYSCGQEWQDPELESGG